MNWWNLKHSGRWWNSRLFFLDDLLRWDCRVDSLWISSLHIYNQVKQCLKKNTEKIPFSAMHRVREKNVEYVPFNVFYLLVSIPLKDCVISILGKQKCKILCSKWLEFEHNYHTQHGCFLVSQTFWNTKEVHDPLSCPISCACGSGVLHYASALYCSQILLMWFDLKHTVGWCSTALVDLEDIRIHSGIIIDAKGKVLDCLLPEQELY